MTVSWKMQHYNNSCACACMAMLLSAHDIDKQDKDVIVECRMPYLVLLDREDKSFRAGMLVQDKEVFDLMLNRYGFELAECRHSNFEQYIDKVDELLSRGMPFMTGIMRPSQNGSHAVVFYEIKDGRYLYLNPDTGLDRAIEHKFVEVRDKVACSFTREQFREAANPHYVIGYLSDFSGQKLDPNKLYDRTIESMQLFSEIAKQRLDDIPTPDYDAFFRFIIDVVKPIALDLCTAIDAADENPELVEKLIRFKNEIVAAQKQVKNGSEVDWNSLKAGIARSLVEIQDCLIEYFRHDA